MTTPRHDSPAPAPAPAYLRIAAELRRHISEGELAPHEALAPEREMSQIYGVSRMTARRALGILQSEGLVYRGSTRGTFVAEPRIPLRLGSFSHELSRSGRQPSAEVLWAEEQAAAPEVAAALDLAPGAMVAALCRMRRSDTEPLALETTYYPSALLPGFLDGDLSGSLWNVLQDRYGVTPIRTAASVEVVVLSAESKRQFGTTSVAHGLQLTRRTYDLEDRCIEYARDIYRSDRVSLTIERTVEPGVSR